MSEKEKKSFMQKPKRLHSHSPSEIEKWKVGKMLVNKGYLKEVEAGRR
jgi:hypothetical protein